MSNPLFDDFLELDMLDMSTSPSAGADMYPFLFNTETELDSTLDPATAAAMSLFDDPLATTSPLSLDMNLDQLQQQQSQPSPEEPQPQEQKPGDKKEEAKLDPSLLAMATAAAAAASLGTDVNPSQLLLTPPAEPLIMSPTTATTSLFAPTTATPTATTKPDSSAARSAKRARSNSLEPSAELGQLAASTKSSSTVATFKTSSTSSRKASTPSASTTSVSPSSTTSKTTTATSTTPSSSSSTTTEASSTEVDAASLTSTTNTTLSAATLQFLLQQQAQAPLVPQLFSGTLTREEIDATLAQLLESTKHLLQPDTPPSSATPGGAASSNSPLGKVKEEASDEEMEDAEAAEQSTQQSTHGLKTQPGIKTDDIPSPTDLKKMTSKERRQLRNKISARNFRVRRKEYISTLEGQVQQHKTEARHLREAVTLVQEENLRLKKELEDVKRQLAETTISNANAIAAAAAVATTVTNTTSSTSSPEVTTSSSDTSSASPSDDVTVASTATTATTTAAATATATATTTASATSTTTATTVTAPADAAPTTTVSPTPLSKENQSLLSAIMSKGVSNALHPNAKANITLSLARPQSPILLPNYHKDVPNSTSAAAAGQGSSWKDKNPILVHRTIIPEVYFAEGFELGDKPKSSMLAGSDDACLPPWMQICKESEEEEQQQLHETTKQADELVDLVEKERSVPIPHLDGMAILYQVMQTCAWTMWMNSTIGDYDGSAWMFSEIEKETEEIVCESVQEAIEQEEEARALAMSYEDVISQQLNEDPQMMEWLYESLMARLVEMDLQQTQQQQQHHQQAGESAPALI
ncbi:hypothetical protein BGW41_007095 [Actinomortierella wolfii]|nr:hypothetical protein BGW41_007095 [Actinomortierella wolfii]